MISYIFKDGPVTIKNARKADPQKIGTALAKIAEQQKGRLTPPAVVDAARDNRHPLHRFFEWDDALAAEGYRLEQARTLIRSVRIIREDDEEPAPAFLSIADKGGTSYRALQEVMDMPTCNPPYFRRRSATWLPLRSGIGLWPIFARLSMRHARRSRLAAPNMKVDPQLEGLREPRQDWNGRAWKGKSLISVAWRCNARQSSSVMEGIGLAGGVVSQQARQMLGLLGGLRRRMWWRGWHG